MKIKLAHTLALFAIPVLANTPPEITNVRASQRTDTKLVDIYYDAADADGDLLKVRIEISDNDGVKYSVPAFSLTGDIGEGIAAGKDKHIVWDAGTDWDGEYSDQMRVKIYAIDAQGFPGLEWGNEVPPGGFLMGQDGGAEGSGPSRHVNIPWSYWLSKYEITRGQYCDFLNAAYQAGMIYLEGTGYARSSGTLSFAGFCNYGIGLCPLGDNCCVRWNVNNFEVVGDKTNFPMTVTYYGAIAFARFYGYDLPTESEWEKAARGPDHDDQDEHLKYPWGNEISSAYYPNNGTMPVGYFDGNQTPVGPDTVNGYGLYDVIGNVSEWTRSYYEDEVNNYPQQESLVLDRHFPFRYTGDYWERRLYRGAGDSAIYVRGWDHCYEEYYRDRVRGFRVARRVNAVDIKVKKILEEDFNWEDIAATSPTTGAQISYPYSYGTGSLYAIVDNGDGSKALKCVGAENASYYFNYTLASSLKVCYMVIRVKNTAETSRTLAVAVGSYQSATSTNGGYHETRTITLPAQMSDYREITLDGGLAVYGLGITPSAGVVIDRITMFGVDKVD